MAEWRNYTRNAVAVRKALSFDASGQIVAIKPITICFPERFTTKRLAEVSSVVSSIGIFAVRCGQDYAVSTVNAMVRMTPTYIATEKYDGEPYVELHFDQGAVIVPNVNIVKDNSIVYWIFDEFISKGKVPWYVAYEDLATLFITAQRHAGFRIGPNHAIMEMFAAAISRDRSNPKLYARHTATGRCLTQDAAPRFIALRNVSYGPSNTTAKLMGSYFDEGLTSALNNPADKTERIEELLRR